MKSSNKTPLTPLREMEAFLKEEEFEAEVILPDNGGTCERLVFGLGTDDASRTYMGSAYFINDLTQAAGIEDEDDDAIFLQFFAELPIEVSIKHKDPLAHWLLNLSTILPVGSFNMSINVDKISVYYAYNLASASREIDPMVFMEVISVMISFCHEFATLTEEVGTGKKDLKTALVELNEKGMAAGEDLDDDEE